MVKVSLLVRMVPSRGAHADSRWSLDTNYHFIALKPVRRKADVQALTLRREL